MPASTQRHPVFAGVCHRLLGVQSGPQRINRVRECSHDRIAQCLDDYPAIGAGYDQMVLDGLGISKDAFSAFIAEKKPTYPELEAWVLEQKGGKLDQAAVDKLNAAIAGYHHSEATRKAILGANNIKDEGKILDAVNLNNLDDWHSFHQQVIVG